MACNAGVILTMADENFSGINEPASDPRLYWTFIYDEFEVNFTGGPGILTKSLKFLYIRKWIKNAI